MSRVGWLVIGAVIAVLVTLVAVNAPNSWTHAVLSGECSKEPQSPNCKPVGNAYDGSLLRAILK